MSRKLNVSRARSLRRNSTEAEACLWYFLRNRQLNGWKFRRQVPVDRYVVDLACLDARLIVELDGSRHANNVETDANRTKVLERCGFRVIRYWNSDVLSKTNSVLEDILAHLERRK